MTDFDNKTDDDIKVYHREDTEKKSIAGWVIGGLALLAIGAALIYLTDIDLTQTAELPEVNVEGGQMPAVDLDVADIDLGSEEVTVEVPTVDIDLPEEENETDDLADDIEVDVDADVDVDVENEPR
ncbi:hypothetical protein [uncultured Algimonas sp.]|uniref:hypothetical protein n=1 Tax=uncultured Algimonas sp. TaxID=1547920 RepID=UPI00260638F2|nr:hypothetical protein [uncultured Algimonas sp.]